MPTTLDRALEIAREAHAGQVDKAGRPVIEHVLRVVDAVEGEDAKVCGRCFQTQPLSAFNRSAKGHLGRHGHCRECQKISRREWYARNREKAISDASAYAKTEKAVSYRKKHYEENRDTYLARQRERVRGASARAIARSYETQRFANDMQYRLAKSVRIAIRCIVIGMRSEHFAEQLVGCGVQELRKHLEEQFRDGMSWNSYGYYGWHVDHRKPLADFDLNDLVQRKAASHYTNLQPLLREENQSKGAVSLRDHLHPDRVGALTASHAERYRRALARLEGEG